MKNKLGVMQGRLLPPINDKIQAFPANNWEDEFSIVSRLGLSCVEWIYEKPNIQSNPLGNESGIKQMIEISKKYNVLINSVLGDIFMDEKLFGGDKYSVENAINQLIFLIKQCAKCKIRIIEIPLVDRSSLKTEEDIDQLIKNLKEPVFIAEHFEIKICFETDLPPALFLSFIKEFEPSKVYVNYDIGNSAALNYNTQEEFDLLGKHIANVHIKDRIKGGGTVPFGEGDARIVSVIRMLNSLNYTGDYILQGARQDLSDSKDFKSPFDTINDYVNFIINGLEE